MSPAQADFAYLDRCGSVLTLARMCWGRSAAFSVGGTDGAVGVAGGAGVAGVGSNDAEGLVQNVTNGTATGGSGGDGVASFNESAGGHRADRGNGDPNGQPESDG